LEPARRKLIALVSVEVACTLFGLTQEEVFREQVVAEIKSLLLGYWQPFSRCRQIGGGALLLWQNQRDDHYVLPVSQSDDKLLRFPRLRSGSDSHPLIHLRQSVADSLTT